MRQPLIRNLLASGAPAGSPIGRLIVDEHADDAARIVLPCPDIHLVVRFGPAARNGLDVHAMGLRQTAYRKRIRAGQRTLIAGLRLGAHEAVLGVPASEITGRIVALEDLWGESAAQRLLDRLAGAGDGVAAAGILERAIAERAAMAGRSSPHTELVLDATAKLAGATIRTVARDLGLSERHLRRVFRDAVGVSPKTFARLKRFHLALDAAHRMRPTRWTSIAAVAGYYDQAHLIAEFRAIAGVAPNALLAELREGHAHETRVSEPECA